MNTFQRFINHFTFYPVIFVLGTIFLIFRNEYTNYIAYSIFIFGLLVFSRTMFLILYKDFERKRIKKRNNL